MSQKVVIFIGDNLYDVLNHIDNFIEASKLPEKDMKCEALPLYFDRHISLSENHFKNIDARVISNDLFLYFCAQTKILLFNKELENNTNEEYYYGFSIPDICDFDVEFYVCGFVTSELTTPELTEYMRRRIEFFFGKNSCILVQLAGPSFTPYKHFKYADHINGNIRKNNIDNLKLVSK